jgi:hypothetical protein
MKKLFALLMVVGLLAGCAGGSGQVNEGTAILTAIELGGYNLGYYVGKSKTDSDDIAIADAYALARTGTLNPAQVAEAFLKFKVENPQLAGSLMIILKNMGADFALDGGLISLSGIPTAYWDRAAAGYASGYEFGRLDKKSVGQKSLTLDKVSAVKAKMPKK